MTKLTLFAACLSLSTFVACKKSGSDTKENETAAKVTETKASDDSAAKPVADTAAAAPSVAAAPTGPEPSKDKEFLGFELKPFGAWTPTWDADSHVAKWENDESMTSIWTTITNDEVGTIEQLKEAAPMNSHLGTAITEVVETKTTPKGYWAVVKLEDSTDFVYVQKYGSATIICSAGLSTGPITQADALQACDSLTLKP